MNNKTRVYKYILNYYDILTYKLLPLEIFKEYKIEHVDFSTLKTNRG